MLQPFPNNFEVASDLVKLLPGMQCRMWRKYHAKLGKWRRTFPALNRTPNLAIKAMLAPSLRREWIGDWAAHMGPV
jgi:hypothetical protein